MEQQKREIHQHEETIQEGVKAYRRQEEDTSMLRKTHATEVSGLKQHILRAERERDEAIRRAEIAIREVPCM